MYRGTKVGKKISRVARRKLQEMYGLGGFQVLGNGKVQYRFEGKWIDSPIILPPPSKPGRPPFLGGRGVTIRIWLAPEDVGRARVLGNGNASAGIRFALLHCLDQDPRRHHLDSEKRIKHAHAQLARKIHLEN